ncbi:antibiotic biosynthesis monooxygenase family protein [Gordonia sp. CPCC 205333]|uniref:antibiotic biosynthesis monooxygenase family protein n=1 Tax=Gordonia sp. CPCC 205333 TaxID=3140790 RepID=UPI003AF355C8
MIIEHVVLPVRSGMETEFENAFGQAKSIISNMPGFVSLRLSRGIEKTSHYLLLVEWESLEDHTIGFRQSTQYRRWSELLHHFYDPFPDVDHFAVVRST